MGLNQCNFSGRLTNDPTGGQTNNGRSYANFSIAVQRNYKNASGEYDADFIKCGSFNSTADYLTKYGHKGDTVNVSGELHNNNWTDQQGNNRHDLQLTVHEAEIVAHPKRNNLQPQQPQQPVNGGYQQQQPASNQYMASLENNMPPENKQGKTTFGDVAF